MNGAPGPFKKGDLIRASLGKDMNFSEDVDIRMAAAWAFATVSVPQILFFTRDCLYIVHRNLAPIHLDRWAIAVLFSGTVAVICGLAWWTLWKGSPSARLWAVAASIMQVAVFVRSLIVPPRAATGYHWGALLIGVIGLGVFTLGRKRET